MRPPLDYSVILQLSYCYRRCEFAGNENGTPTREVLVERFTFGGILFKTHLLGWDWYDMPVYRMAITSTQKHQCPSKGTPWALYTQPRSAVWGYFTPVLLIIHTSGTPYFHNVHQCDRLESISVSPINLGCGSMGTMTSQMMICHYEPKYFHSHH